MKKNFRVVGVIVLSIAAVFFVAFLLRNHSFAVLQPQGQIAERQKTLILTATAIMAVIVVPVLAMTAAIAYRYRATNHRARYSPNLDGNRAAETVWWLIPFAIVVVLGGLIWNSSHALDPSKPIASTTEPLTIQVVALQWKWLFIYPEQNIATVNYIQFPKNTPVNFQITADAPMNSFWIPQLGGQIYAMPGMSTRLSLEASQTGKFRGSSANLSGAGFAGMKFIAEASDQDDFRTWVNGVKQSPEQLTTGAYASLAKASSDVVPKTYAWEDNSIYDEVIGKYMDNHVAGMKH